MRLYGHGALALACYAIHAGFHVLRGHPEDALWACHIAALLIAAGCFFAARTPIAMGILWLLFGNPLWVLDLSTGGEFLPTSALTHVGSLVIGLLAMRRLGWPKRAWWPAIVGFLALMGLTRVLTPRGANVNLAFRVADGWERTFPSYASYFLLLAAAAALTFFVAEVGLRRLLS